jgi:exonuclease VII small subunit
MRAVHVLSGVVVLAALAAGGAYALQSDTFAPACSAPLTYRVGALDPRFGVSETEFRAVLREAADVWNTAAGRTVIAYSAEGEMPVSLMYDERQQTADLGNAIDSDQEAYQLQRTRVDSLVAAHESSVSRHEAALASFERAKAAYDQEVSRWNEQGGAPPGEYQRLEEKRRSLERQQSALNAMAAELNSGVEVINREVQQLNTLAGRVNQKVDVYNAFAGEEFDQGQYISDEEGARITVYEFRTREQLVRAMAHEFGHALGIGHTEAPQSLMYPYNSGRSLTLHAEDLAALTVACDLE